MGAIRRAKCASETAAEPEEASTTACPSRMVPLQGPYKKCDLPNRCPRWSVFAIGS
jgi:hypothetical protein